MPDEGLLSRDSLLGGGFAADRRASRVMGTIEARVSHLREETRLVIQALFSGQEVDFVRTFGDDYLRSLRLSGQTAKAPRLAEIERFAEQWRPLVPRDVEVRAALIGVLAARHGATVATAPATLRAAGCEDPEVAAAVQRLPDGTPAVGRAAPADAASEAGLDEGGEQETLRRAEEAAEWLRLPSGTVLIREGDEPDCLFFVISGRLRVTSGEGPEARVVAELGRGEMVGEVGVLTGELRTATVTAMRDTVVVRIPQAEVLRMAHDSPRMLLRMNQVLARRLRTELNAGKPKRSTMTVAVVACHGEAPTRELAAALAASLESLGTVSYVHRQRAEREFPQLMGNVDPAEDGELLAWLGEQETQHQFVVLEADPGMSPWTDLCIRQADRIALVGRGSGDRARGVAEERIAELNGTARLELVLVHEEGSAPSGTIRWLEQREVAAHHHVVVSDRVLVDRLARRISGQAVGLVLGGGGARGWAHIGVWTALEERGVPVDVVGGTSIGSIMAMGVATGRNGQEMDELGREAAGRKLTDVTLPLVSLLRSKAMTSLLQELSGGRLIEDCLRPFFCVSTSLTRGEPVVHRTGPLWRALRASAAIPGVFSPISTEEGELLVDGGIMNNVPVDLMRAMCEQGPVIAVDLTPTVVRRDDFALGESISGWQVLWSRVNPFMKRIEVPSIASTLLRMTEAGSVHNSRTGEVMAMADLIIRPAMDSRAMMDFKNAGQYVLRGYEAALPAVEAWLSANPEIDAKLRPTRRGMLAE